MAYKEYILAAGIRTDDFFKKASKINAVVEELADKTVMVRVDMDGQDSSDIKEFISEIQKSDPRISIQVEYDYSEEEYKKLLERHRRLAEQQAHRMSLASSYSKYEEANKGLRDQKTSIAKASEYKKQKAAAQKEIEDTLSAMATEVMSRYKDGETAKALEPLLTDLMNAADSFENAFGTQLSNSIQSKIDAITDIDAFEDILFSEASTDKYFKTIKSTVDSAAKEVADVESKMAAAQKRMEDLQNALRDLDARDVSKQKDDSTTKKSKKKESKQTNDEEEIAELEQRAKALADDVERAFEAYKSKLGEIDSGYDPIIQKTEDLIKRIHSMATHSWGLNRVNRLNEALSRTVEMVGVAAKAMNGSTPTETGDYIRNDDSESGSLSPRKSMATMVKKELEDTIAVSEKLLPILQKDNPIVWLVKFWNESDEALIRAASSRSKAVSDFGLENILERSAIIGSDGKVYGAGTYHAHKHTSMADYIKLPSGVSPLIDVHSHNYQKIASSSIAQQSGSSKKEITGDLLAWAQQWRDGAAKYAMTVAMESVQLFDAEGFFKRAESEGIKFFKNNGELDPYIQKVLAVNTQARNDFIHNHSLYGTAKMGDRLLVLKNWFLRQV